MRKKGEKDRLSKLVNRAKPVGTRAERAPVPAEKFGRRASSRPAAKRRLTDEERLLVAIRSRRD